MNRDIREIETSLIDDLTDQANFVEVILDRLGSSMKFHSGETGDIQPFSPYAIGFFDGETHRMFLQYQADFKVLFSELLDYINLKQIPIEHEQT